MSVSSRDRRQAMGNDDRRAAGQQAVQRPIQQRLRQRVEPAGGFVQNDQTRVLEEDARQR